MSNQVVIRPLRFSTDIEAMRRFYELLGLRSRVESERGGWVDMVAGGGMVALHDAATSASGGQPGETRLCFEADEIDSLAQRLVDAGWADATIVDEAFGRALTVTGPGEVPVWIDERSKDLYGYKLHAAHPDPRWAVTPSFAATESEWRPFLDELGTEAEISFTGGSFAVRVELTTTEDLAEVTHRLTAAGFVPTQDRTGLTVDDPDGQSLRVAVTSATG